MRTRPDPDNQQTGNNRITYARLSNTVTTLRKGQHDSRPLDDSVSHVNGKKKSPSKRKRKCGLVRVITTAYTKCDFLPLGDVSIEIATGNQWYKIWIIVVAIAKHCDQRVCMSLSVCLSACLPIINKAIVDSRLRPLRRRKVDLRP